MDIGNIFENIPFSPEAEWFDTIFSSGETRLERIVSRGHSTPAGEWYDQDGDEWVMVLRGRAGLQVEGEAEVRELFPGDYILLPAHVRHRVDWTDPESETIWLAVHFTSASSRI